ncbi:phosphotransferase [Xylanimonas oleitrophica]|nr:phosphotransferase [Xylanimonas oleitrophica]
MPHPTIGPADLRDLLRCRYGRDVGQVTFVPAGEDSWAFRSDDLWISVRRDVRGHIAAAYEGARRLADDGLDFVLAPLRGETGEVVYEVRGTPVVVFPFVPSEPLSARPPDRREADEVRVALTRLHEAVVLPGLDLPRERFSFSFDRDLDAAALRAEEDQPPSGPFDLPFRALYRRHRALVASLRAEAADLGARLVVRGNPPVLTHGDPSAQNWIRTHDGIRLVDWGGLALGPAARDHFHLARTMGAAGGDDPEALAFYEIRWRLSEIAEYGSVFAAPHEDDDESRAMWHRLLRYLPGDVPAGGKAGR